MSVKTGLIERAFKLKRPKWTRRWVLLRWWWQLVAPGLMSENRHWERIYESLEEETNKLEDLTNKLKEQVGQDIDKSHPLYGKRIVMTGFRDKPLKKTLVALGAKMGSSVGKSTFVVLVKDLDEDTSKADEAREMGIPVELVETFREKYSL